MPPGLLSSFLQDGQVPTSFLQGSDVPSLAEDNPPSVRTNVGEWLREEVCGSHGYTWEKYRHPVVTFASPQKYVHIKFADRVAKGGKLWHREDLMEELPGGAKMPKPVAR